MAEMKKYHIDMDSLLIENEEESRDSGLELPPIDGDYITLIKNGGIYYINVENLVAIIAGGQAVINGYISFFKDKELITEDNFDMLTKQLSDDRFNDSRESILQIFNPHPFDDTETIIKNQVMIDEINAVMAGQNGIYIKLLLSTLYNPVNSKKIFSKARDLGRIAEEEHKKIQAGEHQRGNISVDLLVGIREIIHNFFNEFEIYDLSRLDGNSRSLIEDIIRIKKIIVSHMSSPRRHYYLYPFLNSSCTAARTKWLCKTLKYTEANCHSSNSIFTPEHIESAKKIIIDILNNVPEISIDKDRNPVIFKEEERYMIGGKYYKKYLKYKAKYLKIKQLL